MPIFSFVICYLYIFDDTKLLAPAKSPKAKIMINNIVTRFFIVIKYKYVDIPM